MNKRLTSLLILMVIMLPAMTQNDNVLNRINEIGDEFAPDKRVVVYYVKLSADEKALEGETSSHEAFRKIEELTATGLKNNVRLLPDGVVGDKSYGVIYNSMGTIHRGAAYSSETITQTTMGTPVRVLDKKGGWYRIQTPDNYIGWINGSVKQMTQTQQEEYLSKPMVIVTSLFASSYMSADKPAYEVSALVVGNVLAVKGEEGDFINVLYADGREAFVAKDDVEMVDSWNPEQTQEGIVATSKRFAGIPYVWGGTTSKGLDCSGFTKTVYFMHNIILPRDASQQVFTGELVDEEGDFSKIEPGDLVFFGEKPTAERDTERVVHVGVYIGNNHFIHASDYIRVNSFNPDDALYDKFNRDRYLRAKRILGDKNLKSVRSLYCEL